MKSDKIRKSSGNIFFAIGSMQQWFGIDVKSIRGLC